MDLVASVRGCGKAYTPGTEAMGPEDNPKCLRGHVCLLQTAPALKNNNHNFIIYALFVFVVSAASLYSHMQVYTKLHPTKDVQDGLDPESNVADTPCCCSGQ